MYGPAPDPRAVNAETRAQEDQALERQRFELQQQNTAQSQAIQAENLRLRQEAEQRAAEKDARERARAGKGLDATEGERKAAAFLIRALGANSSYENTGVGARSLPGHLLRDSFPNLENYFISGRRQRADSAQDEFIAASLRQDSGAAIPEEELERQRRIYFPMPGDGPEAIEQKRQARLRAIEGLKQSSGRLLEPTLERFEAEFGGQGQQRQGGAQIPETVGGLPKGSKGQLEIDRFLSGYSYENFLLERGVDPNKAGLIDAFWQQNKGNKNLTPEDVVSYYRSIGMEPPSPQDAVEGVKWAQEGGDFYPYLAQEYQDAKDQIAQRIQSDLSQQEQLSGEAGFFDRLPTEGIMDVAAGVVQGLSDVLTGQGTFRQGYAVGSGARAARAEQARENTGALGTAFEIAAGGGAIRGVSGVQSGLRAARGLQAAGQPVNRGTIQNALTRRSTVEGAALGAGYGAAEGEGLEGRVTNALIGGVAGGVLGNVGQRIANRNVSPAPATPSAPAQAQSAADDLGIEIVPSVTGGRVTQGLTAGLRQGIVSDAPITAGVERMQAGAMAARDRAAQAAGQVVEDADAGELVRQGANAFSKRTSQIGSNLYDRAERMAGNIKIPLPNAVRVLDEEMAQLAKAPGGSEGSLYKSLAKLKSDIEGGAFEPAGVRAMKTELRNNVVGQGLRGSPEDRIYQNVVRAAQEDIVTGLKDAGLANAANAYRTADRFWANRVQTIDEVLEPVLGKQSQRSGEQILTALEGMANPKSGNSARLRQLMQAMPDDEASAVRATLISRLGRPTAGSAEEQTGFSFNTFLTNWNKMSPRARAIMFPKESREALDKLATVSQRVKQAGSLENTSNTGRAIGVQTLLSGGLFYLEPFTAAAGALGQYGLGKLLASPKFARLLAGAPKDASPKSREAFMNRLGNLAATEPTIAREIGLYQQALAQPSPMQAGEGPMRAPPQ